LYTDSEIAFVDLHNGTLYNCLISYRTNISQQALTQ